MGRYLLTSLQMWRHRTDSVPDLRTNRTTHGLGRNDCVVPAMHADLIEPDSHEEQPSTKVILLWLPCSVVCEGVPSCCHTSWLLWWVRGHSPRAKPFGWAISERGSKGWPSYAPFGGCLPPWWMQCTMWVQGMLPKVLSSVSPSDLAGMVGKREMGCWWAVFYSWQ